MKKLNFNIQAFNFQGKPSVIIENEVPIPLMLSEQLGAQLAMALEKDNAKIVKYWSWATALGKGQELVLDKADLATLKQFIEACELYVWVKAQLLDVIDNAQDV